MRKSTIPAVLAVIASLSAPAHAAKYTCTFYQAGAQKHQCSIDPTTSNTGCAYSYNSTLNGACLVGKSGDDSLEAFLCWFSAPTANVTEFSVGSDPSVNARTLAEKPGFLSYAYTDFETKALRRDLMLGYRESQSSPVLSVVCQP